MELFGSHLHTTMLATAFPVVSIHASVHAVGHAGIHSPMAWPDRIKTIVTRLACITIGHKASQDDRPSHSDQDDLKIVHQPVHTNPHLFLLFGGFSTATRITANGFASPAVVTDLPLQKKSSKTVATVRKAFYTVATERKRPQESEDCMRSVL